MPHLEEFPNINVSDFYDTGQADTTRYNLAGEFLWENQNLSWECFLSIDHVFIL